MPEPLIWVEPAQTATPTGLLYGDPVVVDLSEATLSDPQGAILASALGESSDISLKTGVQRLCDGDRDAVMFFALLAEDFHWSNYKGIHVEVAGTLAGLNTGTQAYTRAGVVTTADQATCAGALAGVRCDSGGPTNVAAGAAGAAPGLDGTPNMGTIASFDVWVDFTGAGPRAASASATGSAGSNSISAPSPQLAPDLIVALELGTASTGATTAPSWTDLVVTVQLVPR